MASPRTSPSPNVAPAELPNGAAEEVDTKVVDAKVVDAKDKRFFRLKSYARMQNKVDPGKALIGLSPPSE